MTSVPDTIPKPELSYDQKVAVAMNDLPAAGLPEFIYTDGPNGIRGAEGATAFPSGLAVAASFDRDLADQFGEALGRESLAAGRNGILGPGLDIARVPWAGRVAEALGEDPTLVGEIGAAIVRGIQSQGVLAVPKHFVANNFENLRTGSGSMARRTPAIDVEISPRALREIYAEPFRRALVNAGAGAVLSSYNRIDGEYVSESAEVLAILREWGWPGFVTPDFLWAVRDDLRALEAGLDFPALGGTANRTEEMVRAQPEAHLDRIVAHTRWAVESVRVPVAPPTTEPLDDARSQDLAQRIFERGSVLLKNDGVLPLAQDRLSSVALVGVHDLEHLLVMGGSAAVTLSPDRIETLADRFLHHGVATTVVAGSLGDVALPTLATPAHATVRDDVTGNTEAVELDQLALYEVPEGIGEDWSATIIAAYTPLATGEHRLSVTFGGDATLFVDDKAIATGFREASPMIQGPEYPVQATLQLTAGQTVTLRVEYRTGAAFRIPPVVVPGVKVGILGPDGRFDTAAQAATDADVAVVVVGRVSGEAMDIDSIALPGDQDKLIRAVARANPNTIVVTCGAGPILMPWIDDVAAVLHVWNPGERFAPGLQRILFGDAEPGGRLPLTFPIDEQSTPVSTPAQYPGIDGTVRYSEDLLVGYRWFHATSTPVLFPFGHGLGYADLQITGATASTSSEDLVINLEVRNVSEHAGAVIPQIYATAPATAQSPDRILIGFTRDDVPAGETTQLHTRISLRDLAIWDGTARAYRVPEGLYRLEVGLSSTDIRQVVEITLDERLYPTYANDIAQETTA